MPAIMADHNVEGHFQSLIAIWERPPWREIWNDLNIEVESFASLNLAFDISDAELWQACQLHNVVLFTANRNDESSDSLEATIQEHNTESSLPVFTLANPIRFAQDIADAERVAEQMLEYLLDLENYRGAGRIYI
jgi:hypothetical protein